MVVDFVARCRYSHWYTLADLPTKEYVLRQMRGQENANAITKGIK